MSFENYVLDYMPRAVKKVLRNSRAEELTLFGYCMGGTMAAMYASLFPDKPLKNLVLLAAPIDFASEKSGLYGIWFSEKYQNPNIVLETFGNMPASLAYMGTAMLRPITNYVGTYNHVGPPDAGETYGRMAGHEQVGQRPHTDARRGLQTVDRGLLPAEQAAKRRDEAAR